MTRIVLPLFVTAGAAATGLTLAVGSNQGAPAPASAAAAAAPSSPDSVVTAHRSRYGTVLFDGRGFALYLFTRERGRTPACYGACAKAWPPFLTTGCPSGGRGARGSLVGSVRRRDGTRQVTYRGHPLYYYVGDRRPGDILCQNVVEFGGTWLVVKPSGAPVR